MKPASLSLAAFVLALLAWTGCASSASNSEQAKQPAPRGPNAYIYIDGVQQGVTPGTITVRRGFGERTVSLLVGGKEVRTFVVEQVHTSGASDMNFSYWGDESGPGRTFDVSVLPTKNDTLYTIPYFRDQITVEDRKYNLTLVIRE